jgi:hypothetical protein
MAKISLEYFRRLGVCWPNGRLSEAAESWPTNPTWAWFLGERLGRLNSRAEVLERLSVALAHVKLQRIRLKVAPAELGAVCKTCNGPALLALCATLGERLDVEGEADETALLNAFKIATQSPAVEPSAEGGTP